jgi:hypothetical protein
MPKVHFTEQEDIQIERLNQLAGILPVCAALEIPGADTQCVRSTDFVVGRESMDFVQARKLRSPLRIRCMLIQCIQCSVSKRLRW